MRVGKLVKDFQELLAISLSGDVMVIDKLLMVLLKLSS